MAWGQSSSSFCKAQGVWWNPSPLSLAACAPSACPIPWHQSSRDLPAPGSQGPMVGGGWTEGKDGAPLWLLEGQHRDGIPFPCLQFLLFHGGSFQGHFGLPADPRKPHAPDSLNPRGGSLNLSSVPAHRSNTSPEHSQPYSYDHSPQGLCSCASNRRGRMHLTPESFLTQCSRPGYTPSLLRVTASTFTTLLPFRRTSVFSGDSPSPRTSTGS